MEGVYQGKPQASEGSDIGGQWHFEAPCRWNKGQADTSIPFNVEPKKIMSQTPPHNSGTNPLTMQPMTGVQLTEHPIVII